MGKVGFSPIIGLAVVVALAMVAVFGAMSLADPVAAQDTPVTVPDPEPNVCTTAGFLPSQGVSLGGTETYNVSACFGADNAADAISRDEKIATVVVTTATVADFADSSGNAVAAGLVVVTGVALIPNGTNGPAQGSVWKFGNDAVGSQEGSAGAVRFFPFL